MTLAIQNRLSRMRSCRHGTFIYPINDTVIGRSLDVYGEWCEAELRLITPFIPKGATVLDIGANIGTHTVYFANRAGHKGRVLAFEPQPLSLRYLNANILLNDLENVDIFPLACGRARNAFAIRRLSARKAGNYGSFSLTKADTVCSEDLRGGDAGLLTVHVVPVDSLSLESCHFVKIDVEGGETDVLVGMRETLRAFRPTVLVENNSVKHSHSIIAELMDGGYALYWHFDSRFNPRNFFRNRENIFAAVKRPSVNMLAVPHEKEPMLSWQLEGLLRVASPEDDFQQALERRPATAADDRQE